MNAKIVFKNGKVVDIENLQQVYAGSIKVEPPYINIVVPTVSLTFVGDITICCNSDDVLTVIID